ncbi:M20/M25/M40 family metallo-hydrolase [Fulvivirgaceae bacterium BMA10]|uniref:M20/M25/M40 family metallo-hydrolase n=1 Tax=Splendidivirga corallicola TaxID=3051826 RepID=A0ABT8KQY3_9BACT|nr:M20/M25/M40 family metallo-hydrolase [Fulvivirgaceae bacterium BMA10]
MPGTRKVMALLIIIFLVGYTILTLKLYNPPKATPATSDPKTFSAERAMTHLQVIAREPHSAGSAEHEAVRNYIIDEFQKLGLETSTTTQVGARAGRRFISGGQAINILAKLKGTSSNKTILVMSHYDSQPNTPGAADDGAGVVAILESIRALKETGPLKNDVLFLITDLEEVGLLGAEAFVHHEDLKDIGMILNFEARGNSGVSLTFELSEDNGWIIRQFKKAAKYPLANSFAYEVYKVMPNDTDFSMFRNSGISGLNAAFVEGFSNYHSMTDTPENINQGSIQHHGVHLLGLLQHFGNIDLTNTKEDDAIFFNLIANWLVIYPISWDVPLMVLTGLLFLVILIMGYRKRRIKIGHLFIGFGLFLICFLLGIGLTWLLQKGILLAYPYYSNFYAANFYNANFYQLSVLGTALLSFGLCYHWASKRYTHESLFFGALFFHLILMVVFKVYLNTGAYILYFPLICIFIVYLITLSLNLREEHSPVTCGSLQIVLFAPILSLWIPLAYTLFIIFTITLPFAALGIILLSMPLLIPSLSSIQRLGNRLILWVAAGFTIAGLVLAHLYSDYNESHPLQTNLMYAVDADNQNAYWISGNKNLDEWNAQFIQADQKESFPEFYPNSNRRYWKGEAPLVETTVGNVNVLSDTLINDQRVMELEIVPAQNTASFEMYFPENTAINQIIDRKFPATNGNANQQTYVRFTAPPKDGLRMKIRMESNANHHFTLIERSMGIPGEISKKMPASIIPGPGYISNTTQIKRTITF